MKKLWLIKLWKLWLIGVVILAFFWCDSTFIGGPQPRRRVLVFGGWWTESVTEETPYTHPVLWPGGHANPVAERFSPDNWIERWMGVDLDWVNEKGEVQAEKILPNLICFFFALVAGFLFTIWGPIVAVIALWIFLAALFGEPAEEYKGWLPGTGDF